MALDFLILYEHIVRELDCDALLMAELRRRGYSVELFQLMDRKKLRYFFRKKPRVIVTSAMYDNETLNSFVYNNVGKVDRVVNLHWEEVLSREQEESDFYNLNENAAKCVHICWGKAAKDRIVKNGVPEKNAVITGAIHLDFFLPQFASLFKTKEELAEEFGLDKNKKWFCYISSFSCAQMDDKEIEELNDMTNLDFTGFKAVGNRSMRVTLDWFDRLLNEHPEIELIYRPHPSEWDSPPLAEMRAKHPNFHVITNYTVKQWIKVSDLLGTWLSTSIAEIYYAGKNCVVIRPERLYDDYDPVTYEGCNAADSYEKLNEYVTNPTMEFPIDVPLLKSHYDVIDGYPSYMRICDLLEEVYKDPPRDHPFSEGYKPHFNFIKFIALWVFSVMRFLHINPHWFDFLGKKLTDTTERMINYHAKAHVDPDDLEKLIGQMSECIEEKV